MGDAVDLVFPSTHWSMISAARDADPRARRAALEALVRRYLDPLGAYLRSRWKLPPDRADDLLQDFLVGSILEGTLIERARKEKGRFRGLLLTALARFVSNALRDARAGKRAHEASGTADPDETASQRLGPEQAFAVAWARSVLRQALHRMHEHCAATGRLAMWKLFEARVLAPALGGQEAEGYESLVVRLEFRDARHAQGVLANAKRMLTRALRSVVAEYESDPEMIQREIDELRAIVATARGLKDTFGFRLAGEKENPLE